MILVKDFLPVSIRTYLVDGKALINLLKLLKYCTIK